MNPQAQLVSVAKHITFSIQYIESGLFMMRKILTNPHQARNGHPRKENYPVKVLPFSSFSCPKGKPLAFFLLI